MVNSKLSTSSSFSSCHECKKHATIGQKVAEFVCNACLFCVCCPLSIFWCCLKLPCKIGWRSAKRARQESCCGSSKKVFATYSSFSDIDSDTQTGKVCKTSRSMTCAETTNHRTRSSPFRACALFYK